jgi:hypothetical protein
MTKIRASRLDPIPLPTCATPASAGCQLKYVDLLGDAIRHGGRLCRLHRDEAGISFGMSLSDVEPL